MLHISNVTHYTVINSNILRGKEVMGAYLKNFTVNQL